MFEGMTEGQARQEILDMVEQYAEAYHKPKPYKGNQRIGYAGRVYDKDEICNLVDSSLEFWLTAGRYNDEFEQKFARFLGVPFVSTTNSGSSANLLAFAALTAPELGEKAIRRGDEVITVAAAFPTTVTPMLNYGAVPVFVDVTIPQYNIDVTRLEEAYSEKTKAVMIAHSLGNPFDLAAVKAFCDAHDLWLIEDNCDALGATYTLDDETRMTGTIGDIGTSSFYPAHQMTMGEGGAVYTSNEQLHRLIRSYRDWGRDCMCSGGEDNHCGHRFDGQFGELPKGYDHKYVYSHFGYNLKITDMQAAIGCAQLKKLPAFVRLRREHWDKLHEGLECVSDKLILPEKCPNSNPCWFGFIMTAREGMDVSKVVAEVEGKGVQTRRLFSGNIIKHPCFDSIRGTDAYRVVGTLEHTDRIMNDSFWVGVYPGMTDEMLDVMVESIKGAVK
ncbi:MAG: lipopolysaccharide biosynthesis protein RfbH [Atopobiaceae bacterium]|jgi:CDP-6-deoxy-D-xylo-4-hexulose-3-dehydrase|nr:lipopolysaccharide biosynthesis protein RfbH [Atopobiaceae bacterium]